MYAWLILFLHDPPTDVHLAHSLPSVMSSPQHHLHSDALPGTQAKVTTTSNALHLPPLLYLSPTNILHNTYLTCIWCLSSHQKLSFLKVGIFLCFVQCCISSSLSRVWHIIGIKICLNKQFYNQFLLKQYNHHTAHFIFQKILNILSVPCLKFSSGFLLERG